MNDTSINDRVVLYAEDDPNDAFFMRRAFSKLNEHVVLSLVSHGQEAIDYLSGAREFADRSRYPLPMLLLLDIKMPERSGLEVLAWLRSRPEFALLPALMFTSSTQETDVDLSRRLGANAYLVKPSNAADLSVLMHEILTLSATGLPANGYFSLKENQLNRSR
jgi:CheY-like chemotaxis protein